jgi:hypothetical protein
MTPEQEAFEERAAIMEYDGNLPRAEAERLAAAIHPGPWWSAAPRIGFTAHAEAHVDRNTPAARKVMGNRVVGSGRAVTGLR